MGICPLRWESKYEKTFFSSRDFVFLGGYILRSNDGGKKWEGPLYPPNIEPEVHFNAVGVPLPAYNRGALFESETGRIYWLLQPGIPNRNQLRQPTLFVLTIRELHGSI
jgi:hypothetical protein